MPDVQAVHMADMNFIWIVEWLMRMRDLHYHRILNFQYPVS